MSDETAEVFGIPISPCKQCSQPFVNQSGEYEYCNECKNDNVVPKENLRELVEQWRERRQNETLQPAHIEIAELCNDLEELLE